MLDLGIVARYHPLLPTRTYFNWWTEATSADGRGVARQLDRGGDDRPAAVASMRAAMQTFEVTGDVGPSCLQRHRRRNSRRHGTGPHANHLYRLLKAYETDLRSRPRCRRPGAAGGRRLNPRDETIIEDEIETRDLTLLKPEKSALMKRLSSRERRALTAALKMIPKSGRRVCSRGAALSPYRREEVIFKPCAWPQPPGYKSAENLWRAWRHLPHAAEHSSWKPPPVEAEAPPDRSFIEGKTPTTAGVGNGTGQAEVSTFAGKTRRFRLINPAKRCREARENSENRIFT